VRLVRVLSSSRLANSFPRSGIRMILVLALSVFLSILSLGIAQAQSLPPFTSDDQMGEQAYQSYHGGDIDSVSLTSGTLTLNMPFLSYPQRGALHLTFNLMYNNQPQHQAQLCLPLTGKCYWTWGIPAGGALPVERGDAYVSWGEQIGLAGQFIPEPYYDGKLITDVIYFSNWSLQTADGSKHPLANTGTVTWSTNAVWCGSENYQSPVNQCVTANGPFETLDATGWRLNAVLNPCLVQNGCFSGSIGSGTAVDANGLIYGNGGVQDSNGNQITSNSTTITDSLGRQVPLPPSPFSSGNTSTANCPVISGQPAVAKAVLWAPPGFNGGTQSYTFCYASFPQVLPPTINFGCGGYPRSVTRLESIVLPNGQNWQFQYTDLDPTTNCGGTESNFATLSQITLPTGGTISYTYTYGGGPAGCQNSGRYVSTRTVNANDGTGPHTWQYSYNVPGSGSPYTVVTDPLLNDVVHTFGAGGGCALFESQTQYYQGSHSSGTLLKAVNTTYSMTTTDRDTFQHGPANVVPTSFQTVWPGNQISFVTKSYDSGGTYLDYRGLSTDINNNPNVVLYGKVVREQDYDYPSGTSLLRTTNTSYAWQSPNPNASGYLANNLLDLPYSIQVQDGGGTQRAYTYYGYDESSLQSSGITEQKVAGESYPGNQTSVHRWLNGSTTASTNCNVSVSNGYLVSNKVFYDTGEVQQSTDPCAYPTAYAYSSTYFGSLPTTVTNALNQSTTYAYDFNTGVVTSITDPNSQVTTKGYDSLARLTSTSFPDGGSTSYCYTDEGGPTCSQSGAPFKVVVTKAITSSLNETATVVFDGLGRVSQSQLNSDPSGTTYTLTTYDANGRKSQVYNPTRCSSITSNCANETTWGFTTTNYDALGRVTSVNEQDGSTASTNYSAFPCTTVTDEAGKSRESCIDGLGRMTSVFEDPGSSPHLNYETDYTYDALGNLTYANQKGSNSANARTRSFSYDSLSELTSAANPESGTISYAYDADGNVITKTAPLPNQTGTATVTTTNTYDKLNRVTSKSYKDGGNSDPYTPTVQYGYDAVALSSCTIPPPTVTDSYPIGRSTAMCDGSGGTSWRHDQLGRVIEERRAIGSKSVSHYIDYTYNLDGSLALLLTPPMKTLTYTYGGDGRPTKLVDTTDNINFALSATYAPPGEMMGATLGSASGFTGFTIANAYNDRLQPILLSATNSSTSATVFSECFDFHLGVAITTPSQCALSASSLGDNGNVYGIANNRNSSRTQTFTYDALNRIASGQSSGTGGTNWGETYTIDAWGNLTNENGITGKPYQEGLNMSALMNNQLSGFGYDAAGNMTSNSPNQYVYDAENRLVWASGYRYIYDAKGERVEKCQAASATTACPTSGTTGTLYWKGTNSDTLAETDLGGNQEEEYLFFKGQRIARRDVTSTGTTVAVHYYFSDHLGSHGMIESATGTTCEQDIDYYPYGGQEYDYCSGSGVTQNYKFTGKEHDTESGLDYFGARYLGSNIGRWQSPDPTMASVNGLNPQSWNRYAYVLNSPLKFLDPHGLWELQFNDSVDKKGKHHLTVTAKQSQKGDDGASLAKQLGLKGKAAAKFAEKVGSGDNIRLSQEGGRIGEVYGAVERGLSEQLNYNGKHAGPEHSDCSRTAAEIGFNQNFISGMGTNVLDEKLAAEAKPESPGDATVGDIIRYATTDNVAKHFTSFIFLDDNGQPIAFSKSGQEGPYEHGNAIDFENSKYGDIRGINKGESGYYRPQ